MQHLGLVVASCRLLIENTSITRMGLDTASRTERWPSTIQLGAFNPLSQWVKASIHFYEGSLVFDLHDIHWFSNV